MSTHYPAPSEPSSGSSGHPPSRKPSQHSPSSSPQVRPGTTPSLRPVSVAKADSHHKPDDSRDPPAHLQSASSFSVDIYNGQPKRTRASKACDTCRRKRTKCSGDLPCSGCHAFGFHCHYSETTKRRGPVRKNTIKTLESRLKMMESLLASGSEGDDAASGDSMEVEGRPGSKPRARAVRPRDESNDARQGAKKHKTDNTGNLLVTDAGGSFVLYHGRSSWSVIQSPRYKDGVLTLPFKIPSEVVDPASPNHLSALRQVLPFTHEQIMFLATTYFQVIHPYLPIVDRAIFFRTLAEGPDSHPFRALLYAMLIVSSQHVQQFEVLPDAVDDMAEKLHEVLIGYEAPHVWIAQAIVLLSLTGNLMGAKAYKPIITSKWRLIGLSVRCAQEMGLHRDLQHINRPARHNDPAATEENRRRTWFGTYIMDRCISMVTGRPCMIHDDDWDTPLPQGFSDLDGERADLEYLIKYIELCEIMGFVLKYVNAARGIWKKNKTNKAEGGMELVVEIQSKLDKWRDSLPPSLALDLGTNESGNGSPAERKEPWTRRELLHATWHALLLISRRALVGQYDAECRRSSAALVEILQTLNYAHELPGMSLRTLDMELPGGRGRAAPPKKADSRQIKHFLFPSTAIAFFTAWDALLCEVLAGDDAALQRMDRLHALMDALAHQHPAFLASLGLMADTLEAKGIDSSLTTWAQNARRARDMWGNDTPTTTGGDDDDDPAAPSPVERTNWMDSANSAAGAQAQFQPALAGAVGGNGGALMWSSPSPSSLPNSAHLPGPHHANSTSSATSSSSSLPPSSALIPATYPASLINQPRMLPPSGVHGPAEGIFTHHPTGPPLPHPSYQHPLSHQQHPQRPPPHINTTAQYPIGGPDGMAFPPLLQQQHQQQRSQGEEDFLTAMFGDLEDTTVWDLMGFV
ncbi:hypothetical protein PhCBS80983_g04665 [Powellomyces hirtus]|uniref:Zn(2)-C6 fungal-type domain-containing protein n=1 Tax=Powellomyces hirtus TaxID=109895 RepID=A0A507DWZ0_9FUNG|nr:hypothetical protein PhCBS80983_g04665 [Powellomyces hirtus]